MVGRFLWEFLEPGLRRDFETYLDRIRKAGADDGLLQLVARDGTPRTWKYCNALVIEPGSPDYVLASAQDVTELKRAQEAARQMSLTDDLTGLLNRRGFLTLAEEHLRLVRRTLDDVLIFYADMDGLKAINDRFGHDAGSAAIKVVATLLQQTFRESDLIARVGGDEFVVLVVNPRFEDPDILHRRLAKNVAEYNRQHRHAFDISVSIGTAVGDATAGFTLEQLISEADAAMYRRKHRMRSAS
jgi:diguanylate cyclase (GGDEF)-like protein